MTGKCIHLLSFDSHADALENTVASLFFPLFFSGRIIAGDVVKQSCCTLYCEDDIRQDRCIKEQPERSIVQLFYLVRAAIPQIV